MNINERVSSNMKCMMWAALSALAELAAVDGE